MARPFFQGWLALREGPIAQSYGESPEPGAQPGRFECWARSGIIPSTGGDVKQRDAQVTKMRTCVALGLCAFLLGACLSHRLTAVEVVRHTQEAFGEVGACQFVLDIEVDTDLLKDTLSIEVWRGDPDRFRAQVLSSVNPQLRGLAFATDSSQSVLYAPRANEVVVGPADIVRMPSVVEKLINVGQEWIQGANPEDARIVAVEREGGLVVYEIEIPLAHQGYAQYWIDARQWRVRQVRYQDEYLGKGDIRVREVSCAAKDASIAPAQGVGATPENGSQDTLYALDIPDGVPIREAPAGESRPLTLEEAQIALSFSLRTPSYLPEETLFTVAYQLDKNMAMVYAGEHAFTLVQGPHIGDVPGKGVVPVAVRGREAALIVDEKHAGVVLTWREEGLQFAIAGSLEQDQVIRIAESLESAFKGDSVGEDTEYVREKDSEWTGKP